MCHENSILMILSRLVQVRKVSTTCTNGTYSAGGTSACSQCKSGFYTNTTGLSTCSQCQIGLYTSAAGLSTCSQCQMGSYSSAAGCLFAAIARLAFTQLLLVCPHASHAHREHTRTQTGQPALRVPLGVPLQLRLRAQPILAVTIWAWGLGPHGILPLQSHPNDSGRAWKARGPGNRHVLSFGGSFQPSHRAGRELGVQL